MLPCPSSLMRSGCHLFESDSVKNRSNNDLTKGWEFQTMAKKKCHTHSHVKPTLKRFNFFCFLRKKKDTDQLGGIKLDFHFLFSVLNDWTVCFVYQPSYKKQTCTIASLTNVGLSQIKNSV